jgi:hypothetical protein
MTVGKFGHQFTPYTLKMVDVDSYFYNDKTDLGDYPVTGGRLNFRALGLNWSAYAATHDTAYASLSSTAGFITQGLYNAGAQTGDPQRFQPQGGFAGAVGLGSQKLDQSAGVRATWVGKKISVGGTYLLAVGGTDSAGADPLGLVDGNGNPFLPSSQFRALSVYGIDINANPWKKLNLSATITESKWSGSQGESFQFSRFGIADNDRRAWDFRFRYPVLRGTLSGFYKRIGDGFDAPGAWGRLGSWINPRGIEGFGGTLDIPVTKKLGFEAEGASYRYNLLRRAGAGGSDILYLRGGFNYPLNGRDNINTSYEYVGYQGDAGGLTRTERYANVGLSHQFSPNMTGRLLYQFLSISSAGLLDQPGFRYNGNIIATQFQVRF